MNRGLLGVEIHVAVDVLGRGCVREYRFSDGADFLLRTREITHGSPSGRNQRSSAPSSGTPARNRCGSGQGTLREGRREALISHSSARDLPSTTYGVCPTAASGKHNSRLCVKALVSADSPLQITFSLAAVINSKAVESE